LQALPALALKAVHWHSFFTGSRALDCQKQDGRSVEELSSKVFALKAIRRDGFFLYRVPISLRMDIH
jgi:hypothetical protein